MNKHDAFRSLPAVHKLLAEPEVQRRLGTMPASLVVEGLGAALQSLRDMWMDSEPDAKLWRQLCSATAIALRAEAILREKFAVPMRPVLNLTGTVIHTNLGRAPLSERACRAIQAVASGYSNLEYVLASGERGSRHSHVEALLCRLTGAEAAVVVNNNAAAVLLVLSAMAAGGEAILSRGQLVEIGGSFRIPDVMAQSGVRLVEVGTTNKTRVSDYTNAVTEQTRVILRVHTSNYRIIGFTEQPTLPELVEAAHQRHVPVIEDLGSGALFDFQNHSIGDEPTVHYSVQAGVDVVTFSGDKLLGGAQAGIIVGKRSYVEQMKRHPLMRALRVDKLTLAALAGTLVSYQDAELAAKEVPVVRMLTEPYESVASRAEQIAAELERLKVISALVKITLEDAGSTVGGGALPGTELKTRVIAMRPLHISVDEWSVHLRTLPDIPIVARVARDAVLLDVRTLLPSQGALLVDSLRQAAERVNAT